MNTTTPRVFIAATRQNDGKTTVSLGLIAALQEHFPRIGYIKPVGQRFVEIEEQKIDEDIVLMDAVYRLNCPLVDMSPIAVEPAFTRKYLESANNEALVQRIQNAFDRVAWEKDFVLCEGSGHAVEGVLDALDQRFVVRRFKVFAGKGRLDGNGAHVHQRAVQAIHRVHEHDVLVNFLLLDFNKALADGLDVADERKMLLQRGNQAKRHGGLAFVLARGGNKNARRGGVHLLAGQMCVSARIKFLIIDRLHPNDGSNAENVVRVRTARNVRGRP